ncbi:hypothetical protein [Streptomyces rubradiris]|uniref:DUF308 domain-containing protein n=1 Tax=Streptomyces rubradiris TaxID=285531 RepID=A0ABQ3R7K7_STRRR|nr:hypothetical protein [Streptomyces rubradiris]GHH16393.1 hypothetical protein GCM10018792_46050 [Streptomyces rubradiris]GHI51829.1 hypothetical protein Srubr_16750 [Streptomyces rubradiris]
MAEHDSDREGREGREDRDGRDSRDEGTGRESHDGPQAREPHRQEGRFDEDAAWRAIVAGYGEEPPDPPGARPFKAVEDLALLEKNAAPDTGKDAGGEEPPPRPLGGSVSFAPGVGPRDFRPAEPSDDDFDEDDEGHFVPPEPPPLPTADTTARFAWLGVVGGPVLLLLAVLLRWDMTWWLATLGIGGFLGGFVTLVARMRTDDEEDDDPGRGAVV